MKLNNIMAITLILACTAQSNATRIEYVEDAYAMQAPQELATKVDEIAKKVNFTKNYEVVVAKKAGLQINPWNRFISCGTNPGTQNFFIIINPEWFATLSEPQQEFLIGRCFMIDMQGTNPWSLKLARMFFILLALLLIFAFFKLLSRTTLSQQKTAIRVLIACLIVFGLELTVLNKIEHKTLSYYGFQHNKTIDEAVLATTGNREAAIAALEAFDTGIKNEIANGETILVPHKDWFALEAQTLKQ